MNADELLYCYLMLKTEYPSGALRLLKASAEEEILSAEGEDRLSLLKSRLDAAGEIQSDAVYAMVWNDFHTLWTAHETDPEDLCHGAFEAASEAAETFHIYGEPWLSLVSLENLYQQTEKGTVVRRTGELAIARFFESGITLTESSKSFAHGMFPDKKKALPYTCILFGFAGLLFAGSVLSFVNGSEYGPVLLLMAIVFAVFNFLDRKWNENAHFSIEDGRLQAHYGWGKELDIPVSRITAAKAVQPRKIQLTLDDQTEVAVGGLLNAAFLCEFLNTVCKLDKTEGTSEQFHRQWEEQRKLRRWYIAAMTAALVLALGSFLAVLFLTEVSGWITGGCLLGACAFTATAYFVARRVGACTMSMTRLENQGRRAAVMKTPLCPGNVLAVYTDQDYIGRVTVYTMPKSDEVYYVTERVEGDTMEKTFTSEFFPTMNKLEPLLRELDNITEDFRDDCTQTN